MRVFYGPSGWGEAAMVCGIERLRATRQWPSGLDGEVSVKLTRGRLELGDISEKFRDRMFKQSPKLLQAAW